MMCVIADATWPYETTHAESVETKPLEPPKGVDPYLWRLRHQPSDEASESLYVSPGFVRSRT
jgi:hypothetical protein